MNVTKKAVSTLLSVTCVTSFSLFSSLLLSEGVAASDGPSRSQQQKSALRLCMSYFKSEIGLSNDESFKECRNGGYLDSYKCLIEKGRGNSTEYVCGWGCAVKLTDPETPEDTRYYAQCSSIPDGSCEPEEYGWDFICTEGEKDGKYLPYL